MSTLHSYAIGPELNRLVDSGKAVVGDRHGSRLIVPMGKLMGIWGDYDDKKWVCTGGPRAGFWPRGNLAPPGIWDLDAWSKRKYSRSRHIRQAHRQWRQTGIHKLAQEFGPLLDYIAKETKISLPVLQCLLCLTGTKLLEAYGKNPRMFAQNFGGLTEMGFGWLLQQPLVWRWNLIILLYKMPWKRALRRLWPNASGQFLNDLTWSHICQVRVNRIHPTIRRAELPGSWIAYTSWKSVHSRITKTQWLDYHRRWGSDGCRKLEHYLRELNRAKVENIPLPTWDHRICEPDEADRRHRLIGDCFRKQMVLGNPEIVSAHKQNWSRFEPLPAGWRPLITLGDFEDEGLAQHHCVGTYFQKVACLFAHLEYEGEVGTIQWRPGLAWNSDNATHHIQQLMGPCNAPVSEKMWSWAHGCLYQMVQASQTKPQPQGIPI